MDKLNGKYNVEELLSPKIANNPSRFLEILEAFDASTPSRESALTIKKAMTVQRDPILWFLLKKSFRLAAFKLKGAAFKISLAGLEKLLHSPDRLDDLALAITSINKAEAFLASDYFKQANWKSYPTEILPCFCLFYKNNGNSQDCEDLLELTRHPNPTVIAAAVEAIKKLDTGSLRSIIAPLIQKNAEQKESEALEQLYATSINYDSGNISNESKEYYVENHKLLIETLKTSSSDLEIIRILRLMTKYGSREDAEYAKPFLTCDKPNQVRAAIRVLEKHDTEYLCIYLPQLLQDKSSKVRNAAIKSFQSIDKESVESMVISLLNSVNIKQRTIGITTSMLVDFNKVRKPLLEAFSKETSVELLENISLVLAANPDRELVKDIYFASKTSKSILKQQREKIIELISEKVSCLLGGNPSQADLIAEAQKAYEEKPGYSVTQTPLTPQNSVNTNTRNITKPRGFYKNAKLGQNNKASANTSTSSTTTDSSSSNEEPSGWSALNGKAKFTVIAFLLGSIFWGVLFVVLIMKMF